MERLWRDHSLSIVGLGVGILVLALATMLLPEGKAWDVASTIGALFLGEGLRGPLYCRLREARKPED